MSQEAAPTKDLVRGYTLLAHCVYMDFLENISLKEYTTFKIGGPAKYFYVAKNKEDLMEAIKKAQESKLPVFVLGGGSNVLALDEGFNGLVIKIENCKLKIENCEAEIGAGTALAKIVNEAKEASLSGLEWAVGLPGTIGGAIYGNAHAFTAGISDNIKEVEALDIDSMEIKTFIKEECQFSEKQSIFKNNKNLIIISAVLKLEKGDKNQIENKIKDNLKHRLERQPLDYPSAGSVFINPSNGESASSLIDKAGLKGTRVGDAQVSEKHAGFIINLGRATSQNVLDLIEIIKREVKSRYNIDLEPEIQIIK